MGIISLGEDTDVIDIDYDIARADVLLQHRRHETLKTARCRRKPKWTHHPFIMPILSHKRCFVGMLFSNAQLMKARHEVNLAEKFRSPGPLNQIRSCRCRKPIPYCLQIQLTVIDTKPERSICFWGEQARASIWAVAFANDARFQQ